MKKNYTISLFLFLSVGFAQNSKLKGIWVEYKREVIKNKDTTTLTREKLGKLADYYEFFEDSTFIVNIDSYENYYSIKNDTIELSNSHGGDVNIRDWPYSIKYQFSLLSSKLLIFKNSTTIHYFEKLKRFPKIKLTAREKEIIGDWYEYKTEIINESDYKKYTFKGTKPKCNNQISFNIYNLKSDYYSYPKNSNFQIIGDSVYQSESRYKGDANVNYNYLDTIKYIYKNNELIWQENNSSELLCYIHRFKQIDDKYYSEDTLKNYRNWSERPANFPGGKDSLILFAKKQQGIVSNTIINNPELVKIKIYLNIYGDIINAQSINSKNRKISIEKAMRIIEQMPQWEPALEEIGEHAYKKARFSTIINVPIY